MSKLESSDPRYKSTFVDAKIWYIIFVIVYMILYDYFDTYTASFYQVVVSHIQLDLGISDITWYQMLSIASLGLFAVLIIQYLADIVGRKPMMIVVFLGMGLSSMLLGFVKSPTGFTAVFFFMWLFFSSDLWIIIISEEAPPKNRGRYIFLVTFLAAFGAVTIPIVRDIVVTTDPSSWRKMTYWAYLAIPLAFLGLGMKETAAFRNQRHIKQESFNFKDKLKTFIKPFSAGHRKVLTAFIVIGFLTGMGFAVNTTQEVFITNVVSRFIPDEQTKLETVTDVIFIITIGPLLFQILSGLLVDIVGRKPLFIMYMVLNAISSCMFGLFALNSNYLNFLSLKIWGFIWIGSFWTVFLMSKAYCVECFPTEFRSTASGWRSFSYALGLTIGALIASGLSAVISLGGLFALSSSLISIIGIPLTIFLLPETKGKDLSLVM